MRLAALPAILLLGAALSRMLSSRAPHVLNEDFAQPLVVATNWSAFGAFAWTTLVVTLVAAGIAYGALLFRPPSARASLLTAAAALVALFLFTPVFSSDVYAYAAYGDLARAGANPYAHLTGEPANALLRAALWQWQYRLPVCVYGEGFVAIARALVTLAAPFGMLAQLNAFRIAASASLVGAALLAGRAAPPQDRRFVTVAIALNPVALWAACEGHNDTLMLLVALAGIALMRRTPFWGGFIIALATSIKLPALAAAAGAIFASLRDKRVRFPIWLGTGMGLALVFAISGRWWHAAHDGVAAHGHYAPGASAQALVYALSGSIPLTVVATSCLAAILLIQAARTFKANPVDAAAITALAAWLAIPNPYPWYLLWILPIAAFARDARIFICVVLIGFTSLVRYIPDAVGPPSPLENIILSIVAVAPYAVLLAKKNSAEALRLGAAGTVVTEP